MKHLRAWFKFKVWLRLKYWLWVNFWKLNQGVTWWLLRHEVWGKQPNPERRAKREQAYCKAANFGRGV